MVHELGDRDLGESFNEAATPPEPAGGDGPAQGGEGVRDGVDEARPGEAEPIGSDGSAEVTSNIFSRDPNRPQLRKVFNKAARHDGGKQDENTDTGTGTAGGDNAAGIDMEPGSPSRPKPPSP